VGRTFRVGRAPRRRSPIANDRIRIQAIIASIEADDESLQTVGG
jgi:hypothetical protein